MDVLPGLCGLTALTYRKLTAAHLNSLKSQTLSSYNKTN